MNRRTVITGITASAVPLPALPAVSEIEEPPVLLLMRCVPGPRNHGVEFADGRCIEWLTEEEARAMCPPQGPDTIHLVVEQRLDEEPAVTWGVSRGDEMLVSRLDRCEALAIAVGLAGGERRLGDMIQRRL